MADASMLVSIVGQQTVTGPAGAAASALNAVEAAASKGIGVLGNFAAAAAKTAAALGSMAAVGVAGALTASVGAAQSFEKQISAIGAVSGATAEQLKTLQTLALDLGAKTSFSASEAAQGIEELVKAGVSMSDIMGGAAKASLDLAAAGAVSVKDAAEIASNAMNIFGIKGSEMAGVANTIAGAANASAIDVGEFKFSLAAAGAVAATVGIGFKDLSTGIAVLGQNGLKGSDAGTSLKTMLLNLSPSTKAATKEMQNLGIITADGANKFFTAEGKAKSLAEIAGVLQEATKGLTEEQKLNALQTIFGTDAIRAAAIMAREGAAGFNEMGEAIGAITAADVANARLDNLAGSIEKFKGSAETAAITVGMKFTPTLKRLVDQATDVLNSALPSLEKFAEQGASAFDGLITRAQKAAPQLLTAGTAALAFGRNLMTVAQGVIPLLVREFDRLRGLFETSGGTGGILRSVQRLRDGFRDLLPVATSVGRAVANNVVSTFQFLTQRVLPPVLSMMTQAGSVVERTLLPAFAATGTVMRGIFGDTLDWLASTVMPPFLSVVEQTSNFFTRTILPTLPAVAASLRTTLGETVQWLSTDVWPKLTTAATVAWTFISGTILPALPNLARELRTVLGGALEWLATTGWPMVTKGAESIATAFEAVRSRAVPIITALFNGDIKTAISGAGDAFSEFATLATGWLSEQAAKINWASVWSATKDVLTSAAVWFADAATRFAGWLGEQVAKIDWAAVWATAKDVAVSMATWFVNVGTQFATWIGDRVAAIDWGGVWARAVNVAQGMQQWFVSLVNDFAQWIGDRVAAIDWASVWARAQAVVAGMAQWFVSLATDLATWLGAEVAKINWAAVWSNIKDMTPEMQKAFTAQSSGLDWEAIIIANGTMGQQMAAGLNKMIREADWYHVGTAFAEMLFGSGDGAKGAIENAMREGWKILRAPLVIINPLVQFLKEADYTAAAVAFADAVRGFLTAGWDMATGSWRPTMPNWLLPGAGAGVPGVGPTLAPGGRPQPMPGSGGTTQQTSNYQSGSWEDKAYRAAIKAGHPNPVEFVEQMRWESGGFSEDVITGRRNSSAGAQGIAQIMPQYHPGVDPLDPDAALAYAANLMTSHYQTYGNTDEALAAYNGGGGAVQRLRSGRPYGETSQYLSEVKGATAAAQQSMPIVNMSSGEEMVTYVDQWGNEYTVPRSKFDARPGGNSDVKVVGRKAADAAGTQTRAPSIASFGQSVAMGNQFELGLPYAQAIAACGPAAVALFMQATGRTPNSEEVMRIAAKNGWTASAGMGGIGAFQRTLSDLGIKYAAIPTAQADESVMAGNLTAISTSGGAGLPLDSGHYYVAQGYDPASGKFDLGETGGPDPNNPNGQSALKGGSRYMTLDEIVAQSGPINGVIQLLGQIPPAANGAVASIAPIAPALTAAGEAGQEGAQGIAATTDAAGLMSETLPQASEGLATLGEAAGPVSEAVVTMANSALTSVTQMGDGIMTVVTDTAGNTITTMTDLNGQVTSQVTQMADGTVLKMGEMTAGVLTSTTDLGTGVMTTVQDMNGNVVTTITDMAGNVVNQYVQMATGASTQTSLMQATATTAATATNESVSGQIVDMASKVGESFNMVGAAAKGGADAFQNYQKAADSLRAPNLRDTVREFDAVKRAALEARDAMLKAEAAASEDREGEGGGSSGGNSGLGRRAAGGPVWAGKTYLVGELGPELFSPTINGNIIPNHRLTGGGQDGGVDYERLAQAVAKAMPRTVQMSINGAGTDEVVNRVLSVLRREQALAGARQGVE